MIRTCLLRFLLPWLINIELVDLIEDRARPQTSNAETTCQCGQSLVHKQQQQHLSPEHHCQSGCLCEQANINHMQRAIPAGQRGHPNSQKQQSHNHHHYHNHLPYSNYWSDATTTSEAEETVNMGQNEPATRARTRRRHRDTIGVSSGGNANHIGHRSWSSEADTSINTPRSRLQKQRRHHPQSSDSVDSCSSESSDHFADSGAMEVGAVSRRKQCATAESSCVVNDYELANQCENTGWKGEGETEDDHDAYLDRLVSVPKSVADQVGLKTRTLPRQGSSGLFQQLHHHNRHQHRNDAAQARNTMGSRGESTSAMIAELFANVPLALRGDGWGSREATELVLNNLFHLTLRLADCPEDLRILEQLWCVLIRYRSGNLSVILRYLIIVTSLAPSLIMFPPSHSLRGLS
ncbi:unnamed protein product [Protopolystoma xenopodis]|uniref:Uncharacterized protein n=1 Tax=Protopolystoma xenopodis TaxID=117903 RepID=A0A3S5ASB2_9PLAT|nr:unnamed protein product [Protopolystoma xenopodis]